MERVEQSSRQTTGGGALLEHGAEPARNDSAPIRRNTGGSLPATAAKVTLGLLFVFVLVGAFLYLPPAQSFRNESLARLIVLHVPNPIVASILSALSAWFALRYLIARRWIDDVRSRSLASIAMLFWLLTTITGAVFAKAEWGLYWSWDPKQSSIFVLLLLYLAYFALRSGIADPGKQATVAAAYILFAAATVPFLTYILPNATPETLHPKNVINTSGGMDSAYKLVFWSSVAAFCGLAAWMYNLQVRIAQIVRAADIRFSVLESAQ